MSILLLSRLGQKQDVKGNSGPVKIFGQHFVGQIGCASIFPPSWGEIGYQVGEKFG